MKIITLSSEEFNRFSNNHKYNTYYQSSYYAEFAKMNDQFNVHYLGFVDEDDKLIGASLMLYKPLFWGYKFAYAPRGLLIDYDNDEIVKEATIELKKLLKKQKFIFVTVDPLIVASERDRNGKTIQFNNSINRILANLKHNNYEHLGFNLYNESKLPRWNVVARLNPDARTIFNNFDQIVKDRISYCNSIGIIVEEDPTLNIDMFYEFIKKSYGKSGKRYFANLCEAFRPSNRIKIFYTKLSPKKYAENVNKLYAMEEEKNI